MDASRIHSMDLLNLGGRKLRLVIDSDGVLVRDPPYGWWARLFFMSAPDSLFTGISSEYVVEMNMKIEKIGVRTAKIVLEDVKVPIYMVTDGRNHYSVDPPATLVIPRLVVVFNAGSMAFNAEGAYVVWNGKNFLHENISSAGVVCTGSYRPATSVTRVDDVRFLDEVRHVISKVLEILSVPNMGSRYHSGFASFIIAQRKGERVVNY